MRAIKTTTVQVRPPDAADVPRLCDFAEELLATWNARTTRFHAQRVYEHVMQNPEFGVIRVAEQNGELCGFGYAVFSWRAEYGGEAMDLVELYVAAPWRNRGVGRTLLDALITFGRARNITHFTCQVHPGNAAIERALESCGFDPDRRTLWRLQF